MKRLAVIIVLLLVLPVISCSGDGGREMFETAQFEEMQNNREHAVKLYREIVRKHPKSDYARRAEERLKELEAR